MNNHSSATRPTQVLCETCHEPISQSSSHCRHCGSQQPHGSDQQQKLTDSLTDNYSIPIWTAAIGRAVLSFPLGLAIVSYLYLKSKNKTGMTQGPWESWTVVVIGILGIAAVEIGGERGAKFIWALIGIMGGIGLSIVVALGIVLPTAV